MTYHTYRDHTLSCGYVLIRPYRHTDEMLLYSVATNDDEERPVAIPGRWALSIKGYTLDERRRMALRDDVPAEVVPAVVDWITPQVWEEFLWPHIFLSLATARAFVRAFPTLTADCVLLGMGLDARSREDYLTAAENIYSGTVKLLDEVPQPLAEGGVLRGIDVLGLEDDTYYSWRHAWRVLGDDPYTDVTLNRYGLMDDPRDVARIHERVQAASDDGVFAFEEVSIWLPFTIVEYATDTAPEHRPGMAPSEE